MSRLRPDISDWDWEKVRSDVSKFPESPITIRLPNVVCYTLTPNSTHSIYIRE